MIIITLFWGQCTQALPLWLQELPQVNSLASNPSHESTMQNTWNTIANSSISGLLLIYSWSGDRDVGSSLKRQACRVSES